MVKKIEYNWLMIGNAPPSRYWSGQSLTDPTLLCYLSDPLLKSYEWLTERCGAKRKVSVVSAAMSRVLES